MSRIGKAYRARFRALLQMAGARRIEAGEQWLANKARQLSTAEGIPLERALAAVHGRLASHPRLQTGRRLPVEPVFLCDAGLGGLARWLRAAGYDADWEDGIDDDELVRRAADSGAILLTTDSMLTERRLLRDGHIPGLWLPPIFSLPEQLALVFHHFHLTSRAPRCMSCGGRLRVVEKATVLDRIPPRTRLWLDEYFVCERCDKLFWQGTHWQRMRQALANLESTRSSGS